MHAGFLDLRTNMPMNIRASYPGKGMTPAVRADIERITGLWRDCRKRFAGAVAQGRRLPVRRLQRRRRHVCAGGDAASHLRGDARLRYRRLLQGRARPSGDEGLDRRGQERAVADRRPTSRSKGPAPAPCTRAGMLFTTFEFVFLFVPATLLGFTLLRGVSYAASVLWLVAASLFFYAFWNAAYLWLLIPSIVVNFFLGRLLNGYPAGLPKKALLATGIAGNLGVLLYFKYAGFLVDNLDLLFGSTWSLGAIVLPLGISFITFQKIAYLVDAYRGHARDGSFIRFALFVSFFPQLIAGPIVHHAEIMPQLRPSRLKGRADRDLGRRPLPFALGLFKKVILADGLAPGANPAFADAANSIEPGLSAAWVGALAYTLAALLRLLRLFRHGDRARPACSASGCR